MSQAIWHAGPTDADLPTQGFPPSKVSKEFSAEGRVWGVSAEIESSEFQAFRLSQSCPARRCESSGMSFGPHRRRSTDSGSTPPSLSPKGNFAQEEGPWGVSGENENSERRAARPPRLCPAGADAHKFLLLRFHINPLPLLRSLQDDACLECRTPFRP
jgi:hypothetical protein